MMIKDQTVQIKQFVLLHLGTKILMGFSDTQNMSLALICVSNLHQQ